MVDLAELELYQGDNLEAERLLSDFENAVTADQRLQTGDYNMLRARFHDNKGALLHGTSRFRAASIHYQKAIDIYVAEEGQLSRGAAFSLSNYGEDDTV